MGIEVEKVSWLFRIIWGWREILKMTFQMDTDR